MKTNQPIFKPSSLSLFVWMFLALNAVNLNAQNAKDLQQLLSAVQSKVGAIEFEKGSMAQKLEFDAEKPWLIKLEQNSRDTKGRGSDRLSQFNLADIDPNLIRWNSTGGHSVSGRVFRNQKLIQNTINEQSTNYEEDFSVAFNSLQDARFVSDSLKKAARLALQLWEKSLNIPNDYSAMVSLLGQTIQNVEFEKGTSFHQTLTADDELKDLMGCMTEETTPKGTSAPISYQFHASDLDSKSTVLQMSGNAIRVITKTVKKEGLIKVFFDDVFKSWSDELIFQVQDIESAQKTQRLLQRIIPLAIENAKSRLKPLDGTSEAVKLLKHKVVNLDLPKTKIGQSIVGAEEEKLTHVRDNTKGSTVTEYQFEWSDLDEKTANISSEGELIVLSYQVKNDDNFIQVQKNGELQAYTNKIEFYFNEVENLRQAKLAIEALINHSKKDVKVQDFKWLKNTLEAIDALYLDFDQMLDMANEGNACEISLTQMEIGSKGTKELQYQFGLKDIDPKLLKYSVRGKEIILSLSTRSREKSILRSSGGRDEYLSECFMRFGSIAALKSAKATLTSLINTCK